MSENISNAGASAPAVSPQTTDAPEANEADVSTDELSVDAGNGGVSSEKKEAAKAEEKKANKKKFKIKVDKAEEELELDLDNEEEVKKHLQKSRAADKRFQEAAEVRKAAIQFIEELKKNPRKVLSDPNIGVDLKKFAEEIMAEQLAEMEKSPEQKEREAMQAKLEKLEKEAKEKEEAFKKSEFERLQAEQERVLSTEIETALDVGGLPKHPRTVKAMAEMMMIALQNNIDLSPKDIAPIIKNNTMNEFKEIMQALSDDQLEDFLGKEILTRLTKKRVAKAKAPQTSVAPVVKETKPKEEQTVKKQTIRDLLKA